jgi:hypothetical protein
VNPISLAFPNGSPRARTRLIRSGAWKRRGARLKSHPRPWLFSRRGPATALRFVGRQRCTAIYSVCGGMTPGRLKVNGTAALSGISGTTTLN